MTNRPSEIDGEIKQPGHLTDDQLSAYINGDITELESLTLIRAHLEECAECQERLVETQTVVSLLNRMEIPTSSRSFKLDSKMVGPRLSLVDPWIVRMQPAMRRLAAIAAAILVIIVMADALTNLGAVGGSQSSSFDTAAKLQSSTREAAISAASSNSVSSGSSDVTSPPAAAGAAIVAPEATPATTEDHSLGVAQSQTGQVGSPRSSAGPGISYWRLVEVTVGVVVVWLMFLTIALPRLHQRRDVG